MPRNWVPGCCLLAGIALTLAVFGVHHLVARRVARHVDRALPPPRLTDVTNVRVIPRQQQRQEHTR